MSLPATDLGYLRDRVLQHSVISEGGMICVVLQGFPCRMALIEAQPTCC